MSKDTFRVVTRGANGEISINAAVGGVDIDGVLGVVAINTTKNGGNAIHIEENGGTSAGINIYANQGTGVAASTEDDASIQLQSDDGGIGLYSTANLGDTIRIETNGGADENIFIQSVQGTGADSITLTSTVGGVALTANAAAKDVTVKSVLGSIYLEAEQDAADAVHIIADGGNTTGIIILNDTGTGDESILLDSDLGGITVNANAGSVDIEAVGAEAGDIGITAGDNITITSTGSTTVTSTEAFTVTNAFELDVVALPDSTPYAVLLNNSGQVHFIGDSAADKTITMPVEADGLHYKFVYIGGAEDAQDWIIDTGSDTNYFVGGIVQHDTDGELVVTYYSDGDSNSKIGVLTPGAGTFVEMWCTGTTWYVTGSVVSTTNAGVTFGDQ